MKRPLMIACLLGWCAGSMAFAQSKAPTVDRVTALPVVAKSLRLTTTQPGRIVAYEETPIVAKLSGYVESVLVDIGDTVKQDQVLIRLSIPEMEDEWHQKEAALAQADAEIAQYESAVRGAKAMAATAEAGIQAAIAGRGRALAEAELSKTEHGRLQQLASTGSVTAKLVDESLSRLRASEASIQEVEAKVQSAEAMRLQAIAMIEKAEADVIAAKARRGVAQADLAHLKTMMGYREIKAPFAGTITQRAIDTGHYVQPSNQSTTPLLVVARTDKVRVRVDVPELEAGYIDAGSNGDEATITIQSLNQPPLVGRIQRTAWGMDASSRALRTEIDLDNTHGQLRGSMYASVSIVLEKRDQVIALPLTALVKRGDKTTCSVVSNNKIEFRELELGLRVANEIEILRGLKEGDVVVMARGENLVEGQEVAVIGAAK